MITTKQKNAVVLKMNDSIYPKKYKSLVDLENSKDVSYVEEFSVCPETGEWLLNPPISNTGGIELYTVKTYTSALSPSTFSCIVDYLSLTFVLADYMPGSDNCDKAMTFLEAVSSFVPGLKFAPREKGLQGYKSSIDLMRGVLHAGLCAFNGNNDTLWFSLSGQGCTNVDMHQLKLFIQALPSVKLTRIDLAYDDLEGKIAHKEWIELFKQGAFAIKGTAPSGRLVDDMGSDKGNTLYVGSKKNGKEACIYEKGKQLGDKLSTWVRVEGRITSVDRIVPLDAMDNPEKFLAGLYPPFADLSATHAIVAMIKKHSEIALDVLIEYASIAYGKLFNVLRSRYSWTDAKIVQKLIRDGIPKRLMIPEQMMDNLIPF